MWNHHSPVQVVFLGNVLEEHAHRAGRKGRILAGRENKAAKTKGMFWLCSGGLIGTNLYPKSFHIEDIYLIKRPRQWSQKI